MLSKKDNTGSIQRSRLPKNCRRLWTRAMRLWTPAMAVGFQPIREFPGISRCWDVEDQRGLVLCCGGSIWHFWRRQMQLLQQDLRLNGVEISDLRVLCFGSVFRFLVLFFTPSLIHTSSPHPKGTFCTPKMTSKQQTTGTNSILSLNLNASFTICQTKRPRCGPKAKIRQFLVLFSDIIFLTEFFPLSFRSLPEATPEPQPEATAASSRQPEILQASTTPTSTRRPTTATSRPCGTSSAWLRSACTRKTRMAGGLKRMAELRVCGWCCGWKVPEEIQHSQVWC